VTTGSPRSGAALRADAIVVAAGSSQRMNGVDKLAVPIAGRPVLAWALAALAAAPEVARIIVVTAPANVAAVRTAPWLPSKVVGVAPGGRRRQESVAAGFAALEELDRAGARIPESADAGRVVLIHDGARPLVSAALVSAVAQAAARHGAAIPILPVAETLKRIDGELVAGTVDRTGLATAQTPQGVRREILQAAYRQVPPSGPPDFTDEAALLEACRIDVRAIPGEPANLKVTVPDDLARCAALLDASAASRFGIGTDWHPFGSGRPLALGGIEIPDAPRLHGHSDGDVALHALAEALLGAARLGDLGRLFPADERTPKGIASRDLLGEVLRRVAATGFRPASADLTIVGSRPRLAGRLDAMRDAIASLLGIEASAVNVKASTGNLGGDEGAGRAISATAIASLERVP
jgi:2-C-methyl-D-erythritol 4-phosphate cytidylyltransferase/2-C-methyl-D-erythritol 2,4-cyclodiphosphate synthase